MAGFSTSPGRPVPTGKFEWETEETLVDRRNRLPNRILRFLRSGWFWLILSGLFAAAMFDAEFMTGFIAVMGVVITLGVYISLGIVQIGAMYWFVSRTRMYHIMPGTEGVSFDDYRGQPELLEQAQQMVMLLRGVKAFEGAGGEPLNGLLLEGPPGTGKTWLAKAISTEAGVPFFYVDTSSLQGMFMGVGAMKVGRVYSRARKAAKEYGAAVVFLDEIDSVGARSGVSAAGGRQTPDAMGGGMGMGGMGVLSTLLIEMSGFGQEHGWKPRLRTWFYRTFLRRQPPRVQKRVLTIGATNRIAALDAALLRPGRFDKKVRVDVPDMMGRREILEYYLSKMAHDDTMDPAILATETPDYSPADLKYLLNESLRYALFDGRRYITYRDFRLAQPEHEMGLRAPLKHISLEAKRRLAYHEAGHAVAIRLFKPDYRIARITIVRQGVAFGHVWHYSAKDKYKGMATKLDAMNHLRVTVAGKAAEIEFCGIQFQTLGVGGDLNNIRELLRDMVLAGMFGAMGAGIAREPRLTDDQLRGIEEAYQQILVETREALRENAHIVEALVDILMEKEEMLADEVRVFFDQYGLYTPDPVAIIHGEEINILRQPEQEAPQLPS